MVLFFQKTLAYLYDVSMLVLSPIVTRNAALQLHNNNTEFVWWGGVGGWVASYQLSCNSQLMLRLRLRLSWAVTIRKSLVRGQANHSSITKGIKTKDQQGENKEAILIFRSKPRNSLDKD